MSKREELQRKQEAAGIPDSKPFVAPEAERLEAGVDRMLKAHINGVLVAELNLDPQVLGALDYHATDEGIAEQNARPMVREASGVSLGQDEFGKALVQRRDDVKNRDMDLTIARNPFTEVAERYAVPGKRAKFLSARRVQENGGTGDYEIVHQANGDPVKVKGQILGHIDAGVADAQKARNAARGNQLLKQIGERYKAEGGATAVADQ